MTFHNQENYTYKVDRWCVVLDELLMLHLLKTFSHTKIKLINHK